MEQNGKAPWWRIVGTVCSVFILLGAFGAIAMKLGNQQSKLDNVVAEQKAHDIDHNKLETLSFKLSSQDKEISSVKQNTDYNRGMINDVKIRLRSFVTDNNNVTDWKFQKNSDEKRDEFSQQLSDRITDVYKTLNTRITDVATRLSGRITLNEKEVSYHSGLLTEHRIPPN